METPQQHHSRHCTTPKQSYLKLQWFTPAEVAIHNVATDCWVICKGLVYDLTQWLQHHFKLCNCIKSCSCPVKTWYCSQECVEYCPCFKRGFRYCDAKRKAVDMLAYAGKDITHQFDKDGFRKSQIHAVTGNKVEYRDHGHGHRMPVVPSTRWRPFKLPWYLDNRYVIGCASAKARPIRILNMHTSMAVILEVASEETIYQILVRYSKHNSHLHGYTFRYLGRRLDYNKTLEQNGILDNRDSYTEVGLPENMHIPSLLAYFNDDLSEDPQTTCHCLISTYANQQRQKEIKYTE